MSTISLVMIVRNEEAVLNRCLQSARHLVDELIVVDTGSTDNTINIALSHQAKVFDFQWRDNFAEARNYALQQSSSDWNLILDADEYISNECSHTIRQFISDGQAIGRVKRIDKFKNKDGVAFAQNFISRIIPRGLQYSGRIHEQVVSDLPRIKLPVELEHDGYYEKSKAARNIPILLLEIQDFPNSPYYHYQIAKEYKSLERHDEEYYHLKKAYDLLSWREQYASNIVVNLLYAILSLGKLEEGLLVIEKEQQKLFAFTDFHFVSGLFYMDYIMSNIDQNAYMLPLIEMSYKTCLQIGETDRYDSVIGTGSYSALYNLGVYYEVTGDLAKAKLYYEESANYQYAPSQKRLLQLTETFT